MNSEIASEQRMLQAESTPLQQSLVGTFVTETSPTDVLLGRGVDLSKYQGNYAFRCLIQSRINDYIHAKRTDHHSKGEIPHEIYKSVVGRNGRFLRRVKTLDEREKLEIPANVDASSVWVPVQKEVAIKKIKQALRDCERGDQRNSYKTKSSEETALTHSSSTNCSRSNKIQKRKYSSDHAILEHTSSLKSATGEHSLESLVTQTIQKYQQQQQQQQHQERIQSFHASVPLSLPSVLSQVLTLPLQSESETIANDRHIQPVESALYYHPTAEISRLSDASYFSQMKNYMEALQRFKFETDLHPSFSNECQSHISNVATTNPVRHGNIDLDTAMPFQQQEYNYSHINLNRSVHNCDTLRRQLIPGLPLQTNTTSSHDNNWLNSQLQLSNDHQDTPPTTLQQQMLNLPFLTNCNMIVQQHFMNDRMNSNNNITNMTVHRNLLGDHSGPSGPIDQPQSNSMYLHSTPQGSTIMMMPSTHTAATRLGQDNNMLLPQPASELVYTLGGRAIASLPNNPQNTDDDWNNNNDNRNNIN